MHLDTDRIDPKHLQIDPADLEIAAYRQIFDRQEFDQPRHVDDKLAWMERQFVLEIHQKGLAMIQKPRWDFWMENHSYGGELWYDPCAEIRALCRRLS